LRRAALFNHRLPTPFYLNQALSKRIHYGKFVAEAKFLAQTEEYTELIRTKDAGGIMALLTDLPQEERVIERVRRKAGVFGQDVGASADNPVHKVDPEAVASLYKDWLMPLTKDVEVDYLLRRLEWDRR
jgi:chorismate mutase